MANLFKYCFECEREYDDNGDIKTNLKSLKTIKNDKGEKETTYICKRCKHKWLFIEKSNHFDVHKL